MKKVLVTGANGFLGASLVKELFRRGYEVRAMVRPQADLQALTGIPCEIFYGHIDNAPAVQQAVEGCHIVIHTAAITGQWGISMKDYERINFTATQYVAAACIRSAVQKLIFVSTANTIGPGSKNNPGTELNGFTLFKAHSAYIATKYLAQQYLLEQAERCKLPVVIVNPTFMIGPHDSKPSSGKLLLYAVRKGIKFYPPGGKNFVYIQDVCRGIIHAIDRGKTGSCYLLAGQNMSYKDFFRLVRQTGGRSGMLIPLPGVVIKLTALAAAITGKIVRRPPKLTWSMAYLACVQAYYSGKKAEKELGIQYTPIDEAVRRSLQWFRENDYYR